MALWHGAPEINSVMILVLICEIDGAQVVVALIGDI